MQTIHAALKKAASLLATISKTPELDAEVLLMHTLNKSRAYLYTWPEEILTDASHTLFFSHLQKRQQGEPVAYITGQQEFWSLNFKVTHATLIPRPDTELLVELVLKYVQGEKKQIADLGTGSGAIALAIAHEKPDWIVHATDKSMDALEVARQNAHDLALANVIFHQGSWCDALPKQYFDVIVSNPPYVAENDEHLKDLMFEPRSALVAGFDGLSDIQNIISNAKYFLAAGGYLMLEHGFEQAEKIRRILEENNYERIATLLDMSGRERVTVGVLNHHEQVPAFAGMTESE